MCTLIFIFFKSDLEKCGRQPLKWFQVILVPWYSHMCVITSLWEWARNSDLLLMNKRWHTSWDVTSAIGLQKDCSFFHVAHPLLLSLFAFLGALTLQEACYYTMNTPVERSTWQGTNVSNQQPARHEFCPQPFEWGRKWASCDLPRVTWVSL